ncbi:unnamed protein product [Timema podura]|uniref:CLEC16A/TT9 C-terminal domain-containing protein n=1 Tax=Timema podura TaxID=61482 RepID=A0ABN7PET6_TIMPD|nr:unnamed protein product [Timema podura]
MAANQRLSKGRIKARQKKMHMIARLLDLPSNALPCPSPPVYNLLAHRHIDGATQTLTFFWCFSPMLIGYKNNPRVSGTNARRRLSLQKVFCACLAGRLSRDGVHHRPLFTVNKVPGFAAAMRRESLTPGKPRGDSQGESWDLVFVK